jgi:hypothetical protein
LRSPSVGHSPLHRLGLRTCRTCRFEIDHDLGQPEQAHRQRDETDAVEQHVEPHRHPILAGRHVGADETQEHAEHDHTDGLEHRSMREYHRGDETEQHDGNVVRRLEQQRDLGERRAAERDQQRHHRSGEQRSQRRDCQRRACPAVLGHGVAVEHGDHGRGFAGNLDEDGGGRAAVLRAVENAGQHDQRAHRREPERDRQDHRHGGERSDPRQHADRRSDHAAEQAQADVLPGQRNAETHRDIGQDVGHVRAPAKAGSQFAARLRRSRHWRRSGRGKAA